MTTVYAGHGGMNEAGEMNEALFIIIRYLYFSHRDFEAGVHMYVGKTKRR